MIFLFPLPISTCFCTRIHPSVGNFIVLPLLLLLYAPVPEGVRAIRIPDGGSPIALGLYHLQVQPRQQTQLQQTTQQLEPQTTPQTIQTQPTASSTFDFWWPYPFATADPIISSSGGTSPNSTAGATSSGSSSALLLSSFDASSTSYSSTSSVSFSSTSASTSTRSSPSNTAKPNQNSSSSNNTNTPLPALIPAFAAVGVFALGLLAWVAYSTWARRRRRIGLRDVEGVVESGGHRSAPAHAHRHGHRHKHCRPRGWGKGKGKGWKEKETDHDGEELLCGPEYGVGLVGADREMQMDGHRGWRPCDSPPVPSWAARVPAPDRASKRDGTAQALWTKLGLCEPGEEREEGIKYEYDEDEDEDDAHLDPYEHGRIALPSVALVTNRVHSGLKPGGQTGERVVADKGRWEEGRIGEGGLSARPSVATRRSDATSAMLCAMYESASESGDDDDRVRTLTHQTSDTQAIDTHDCMVQGRKKPELGSSWGDRNYASIRANLITRVKEAEDARARSASRALGGGTAGNASLLAAEADSAAAISADGDGRAFRRPGGVRRVVGGAKGIDGGGELEREQMGPDNDIISRVNNSTTARGSLAVQGERGRRGLRGDEGEGVAFVRGSGRGVGGVVGEGDGDGRGHGPAHAVAPPGHGRTAHGGHGRAAELRAAEDTHTTSYTAGGARSACAYPHKHTNASISAEYQMLGSAPYTQLHSIKPLRSSAHATATAAPCRGVGQKDADNATGAGPRLAAGPPANMKEVFDKMGLETGGDQDAAGLDFEGDVEYDPVSGGSITRAWRRGSKRKPGDPDADGGGHLNGRGRGDGYGRSYNQNYNHGNGDHHIGGDNSDDELKYLPPAVPLKAKTQIKAATYTSPPPRGRRGYAPLKRDTVEDEGDRYTRAPARRSQSRTQTRSASRENEVHAARCVRSPLSERHVRAPGALPQSPAQLMSPALAAQMCFTAAGEGMATSLGRGASEKGHRGPEDISDRLPVPFPSSPISSTPPKSSRKSHSAFPARLRKKSRPKPVSAAVPSSTRSTDAASTSHLDKTHDTPNVIEEAARERVAHLVEVGWGARERVIGLEALRSLSPTGFGRERA